MTVRLTLRRPSTMAGITGYTRTQNVRAGVVGVGIQKTDSSMTVTAFSVGNCMAFVLTGGHGAVVASRTCSGNI